MAATTFESNTLLLVNVADGKDSDTQYYVHIRYTDDPEQGPLVDTPAAYIGIYVGPEETPPDDLLKYKWSKYGGESSYIDIRYSDDSGSEKELTTDESGNPTGLSPGSWMGVLVTDNPIVLDPNWYPTDEDTLGTGITIQDYTWTNISQTGADGIVYFIEYNYENKAANVYKFYSSEQVYTYTPETFTVSVNSRVGAEMQAITNAEIQCKIYHSYVENGKEVIGPLTEILKSTNGNLKIELNNYSLYCIEFLVFDCYIDGERVLTETKDIPFGTKKEMAQLSINAKDIVASIQNTKLTFNTDGLTVRNGGFKIFNNDNTEVFFANEKGDLTITGTIFTMGGKIGGWKVDQYGLYSEQELSEAELAAGTVPLKYVGLYAGGDLYYPDQVNKSPIRIWAGQFNDEKYENSITTNFINYNFAVTEDGTLYSKNAFINGSVVATSGHIENDFYVGSDADSSIVIHGGNNSSQSYIGTGLFSSGALGYGWKISQDGTAEFNNIIARGKIESSVFEYNKISSVGGSLYIAPTIYAESSSLGITGYVENEKATLYTSWEVPYSIEILKVEQIIDGNVVEQEEIVLKNVNGRNWRIGDEIKLDGEILIKSEKLELSDTDGRVYNIQQVEDNLSLLTIEFTTSKTIAEKILSTEDETNYSFLPGTILILYGSEERRHGLYLTAAGSNSPYMDVYDDSENNTIKPAVRIGNLSGITDTNFPVTEFGYGLYSSNAYLRGQLMLPGAGITNQTKTEYGEGEASSPIRIWAGLADPKGDITKANFIVTANGYLYAKQGIFEGTVKATNSEFSGSIKAAGIVIDNPKTTEVLEAPANHFFVAYKENPSSFHDYVLNIDSTGLSVWEGGLRAYSDYASTLNNTKTSPINTIYGYEEQNYKNPLPFFSLVDDGNENEINPRVVAYKAHFLEVENDGGKYLTNSIIFDRGIWFANDQFENKDNIEYSSFYRAKELKTTGITANSSELKIQSNNNINITPSISSTVYVGAKEEDIKQRDAKMFVRGQLQLVNDNTDNLISFQKQIIREAKINNVSVGIDIIVS